MTAPERAQAITYLGLIEAGLAEGAIARERERGRAALTLLWGLVGEVHTAESHAPRRKRKAAAATDSTI